MSRFLKMMVIIGIPLLLACAVAFAVQVLVKVSWDRNTEPDMSHYVLSRKFATESWVETVVPHPTTGDTVLHQDIFDETVSEKQIWYKCAAVDTCGNQSAFCDSVGYIFPVIDITAPGVPGGMAVSVELRVSED